MKSGWVDRDAEAMVAHAKTLGAKSGVDRDAERDLRCASTRRGCFGRDPKLVLHGGGNTSLKMRMRDPFGEDVEVLRVKSSGADMATIEPDGLPAVRLAPMRKLRALDAIGDEELVGIERANLIDPAAPNPSVEMMLHAFLPHKFIDHTHATAVLSVIDQPDGEKKCAEVFGGRLAFVPYLMPGFGLAKKAIEVFETQSRKRRAHSQQARHRHVRRNRARSLRAHDRDGVARRGFYRAEPQNRRGARHRAYAAGRRRSRRSYAARAARKTTRPKAHGGGSFSNSAPATQC